jgi:hypothetical protein
MCCPRSCPSHEPSSDSVFGSSAFPRRTARQYPDCQYPWHTGRQCPIAQRSVSRHPSQVPVAHMLSVPSTHRRLTGRQCPKQLVSRHPSQFPVAHRPSLNTPCSDDGLAAVPARATSVLASGPRESGVRVSAGAGAGGRGAWSADQPSGRPTRPSPLARAARSRSAATCSSPRPDRRPPDQSAMTSLRHDLAGADLAGGPAEAEPRPTDADCSA